MCHSFAMFFWHFQLFVEERWKETVDRSSRPITLTTIGPVKCASGRSLCPRGFTWASVSSHLRWCTLLMNLGFPVNVMFYSITNRSLRAHAHKTPTDHLMCIAHNEIWLAGMAFWVREQVLICSLGNKLRVDMSCIYSCYIWWQVIPKFSQTQKVNHVFLSTGK